jgi:hypothetical protein
MLQKFNVSLMDWLGESKYMYGLKIIPATRFSSTNTNGLCEYSPFLCGVGSVAALELAYGIGLKTWDGIPEPICTARYIYILCRRKRAR